MMGVTGAELAALAAELDLDGFGANCGNNLAETEEALREAVAAHAGRPVVAKANAGVPVWRDGGLVYDGTPAIMAAHAHRMRALGARLIGACCGSSPAHLQAMRAVLDGDEEPPDHAAPGPAPAPSGSSTRPATRARRRRRR